MNPTKHARTNYRMLKPLIDGMDGAGWRRYESAGYMPLTIEALYNDGGATVYSLAHYGKQNSDLMRDPDMTMKVNHEAGTVEPLEYQNDYMGLYQSVYRTIDGKQMYSPRLRASLDDFLWHWLQNIGEQGYITA